MTKKLDRIDRSLEDLTILFCAYLTYLPQFQRKGSLENWSDQYFCDYGTRNRVLFSKRSSEKEVPSFRSSVTLCFFYYYFLLRPIHIHTHIDGKVSPSSFVWYGYELLDLEKLHQTYMLVQFKIQNRKAPFSMYFLFTSGCPLNPMISCLSNLGKI